MSKPTVDSVVEQTYQLLLDDDVVMSATLRCALATVVHAYSLAKDFNELSDFKYQHQKEEHARKCERTREQLRQLFQRHDEEMKGKSAPQITE